MMSGIKPNQTLRPAFGTIVNEIDVAVSSTLGFSVPKLVSFVK
jgi:hypothetical protein